MEIGWWKDKSQKITGNVEENQNWGLKNVGNLNLHIRK
jgi:hypothetical protein